MIYESILNNRDYIEICDEIGQIHFITDGKWDWDHGKNHYMRVSNFIKKILMQLGATDREIDLGMSAGLLHDVGLSVSGIEKKNHAKYSAKIFRKYLANTDITKEEEELLEDAIKDHSKGNNINSIIGLSLVLADKLDVTEKRVINSTIDDDMNREILKIKDVDIIINDNDLVVKYTVSDDLNIGILMDWDKMFTIPKKIADYLNKNYIFLVNDKEIKIS